MNSLPPNRWSSDDFSELEHLISGAKQFVVPSADFRSRVVESAVSIDQMQIHWAKLRSLLLLALAVWVLVLILYWISSAVVFDSSHSNSIPQAQPPNSSEYTKPHSSGNE